MAAIKLVDHNLCNGCQACLVSCSQQAIKMCKQEDGFLYPQIEIEKCVECHNCEKHCPILNSISYNPQIQESYIVKSRDKVIRENSSSGGVFTHIANSILRKGGVVVGASFSHDFYSVKHVVVETSDGLSRIRGSKYLQSDINRIYENVKQFLNQDRYVLFTGTGCQIAGLRSYLSKEYEKLVLIDVVCHGVPSQDFWERYLKRLEKQYNSKAKSVNFRSKKINWEHFGLLATFGNNVYFNELKDDKYLEIFQRNLSLRNSCYHCSFKSLSGISDISIGDLWGANTIAPDFNDNRGISFVLVNTNRGKQIIQSITDQIDIQTVDLQRAIANNGNIAKAAIEPNERDAFFKDLNTLSLDDVLNKYTMISKKEKIKRGLDKVGLLELINKIRHGGVPNEYDKNLEYGLLVIFE